VKQNKLKKEKNMLKTSNFYMNNTFYNTDNMEVLYAGNYVDYSKVDPRRAYDEVFYYDKEHNEFFVSLREYDILYNWRKTKKEYVLEDKYVNIIVFDKMIESLVNIYGEIDLAKGLIDRFSKKEVKKRRGRKPKEVIDNRELEELKRLDILPPLSKDRPMPPVRPPKKEKINLPPDKPTPPPGIFHKF
jgi:hypothetical protein